MSLNLSLFNLLGFRRKKLIKGVYARIRTQLNVNYTIIIMESN